MHVSRKNWRRVWIFFDLTFTAAVAAGCCWVIWYSGLRDQLPGLARPVLLTVSAVGWLGYVAFQDVRNTLAGRSPTIFDSALIVRITLGWVILGFFLIDRGSEIGYAVIFAWPTWMPVLAAYWAYRRERLTALAYAMSIPPLFLLLVSDAPAEIQWQAYLVPAVVAAAACILVIPLVWFCLRMVRRSPRYTMGGSLWRIGLCVTLAAPAGCLWVVAAPMVWEGSLVAQILPGVIFGVVASSLSASPLRELLVSLGRFDEGASEPDDQVDHELHEVPESDEEEIGDQ